MHASYPIFNNINFNSSFNPSNQTSVHQLRLPAAFIINLQQNRTASLILAPLILQLPPSITPNPPCQFRLYPTLTSPPYISTIKPLHLNNKTESPSLLLLVAAGAIPEIESSSKGVDDRCS
ncbi:hypothetical protein HanRHA438_Chr06g0248981 [Helianthus annuus]|nr:hypothetical protein HanHA89_Chr06g0211461 [Helianthus annuus]KAJ0910133.1 hypothetical protein HanRHA438_Chr06g0248981 [Helianthus annuus]